MYHDDPESWEWLCSTSGTAVSGSPDMHRRPSGPWTRPAAAIGWNRLVLTGQTLRCHRTVDIADGTDDPARPCRHLRQRDGSCPPCRGVRGASERRTEALSDAHQRPPDHHCPNRNGWS